MNIKPVFSSRNFFAQILVNLSSCKQNLMHLCCVALSLNLSFFERFGKRVVLASSKRGCISALRKSLHKGGKLCGNLLREFTLSITFKAIDSPERPSHKIHSRYFTFACCLISVPLYIIFKDVAFQSLCSATSKIDYFVLSEVYT